MSQTPVYAVSDEHVTEEFGTTSSNTHQYRYMEPKVELPSLSDGNKCRHFPFMKLPVGKSTVTCTVSQVRELTFIFTSTEIRLEVYAYLLIATPFHKGLAELDTPTSKGIALDIYCTFNKRTACRRVSPTPGIPLSKGLTPQILRTCRSISQEATPILYCRNLFQFHLRDSPRPWEDERTRKDRLESLCQDLYLDWLPFCVLPTTDWTAERSNAKEAEVSQERGHLDIA